MAITALLFSYADKSYRNNQLNESASVVNIIDVRSLFEI